jgi:hypothetical protein
LKSADSFKKTGVSQLEQTVDGAQPLFCRNAVE